MAGCARVVTLCTCVALLVLTLPHSQYNNAPHTCSSSSVVIGAAAAAATTADEAVTPVPTTTAAAQSPSSRRKQAYKAPQATPQSTTTSSRPSSSTPEEQLCVSWRQTAGCEPFGKREPHFDRPCGVIVPPSASGYCECAGAEVASRVGCAHATFTCAEQCMVIGCCCS